MKLFKNQYPKFKDYIDTSVYRKGYFRLPNQTNNDKLIPHIIVNGDIEEFIITYVDEDTDKLIIKEFVIFITR